MIQETRRAQFYADMSNNDRAKHRAIKAKRENLDCEIASSMLSIACKIIADHSVRIVKSKTCKGAIAPINGKDWRDGFRCPKRSISRHRCAQAAAARSNKGLSFSPYRALYPPHILFAHWLSGAARLKVRRFNFYSCLCNIRLCRRYRADSPAHPIHRPFEKRYPEISILLHPSMCTYFPPFMSPPHPPRAFVLINLWNSPATVSDIISVDRV